MALCFDLVLAAQEVHPKVTYLLSYFGQAPTRIILSKVGHFKCHRYLSSASLILLYTTLYYTLVLNLPYDACGKCFNTHKMFL